MSHTLKMWELPGYEAKKKYHPNKVNEKAPL